MKVDRRSVPHLTLLDMFFPSKEPDEEAIPLEIQTCRFKYYVGNGELRGTNDEVLGWNAKRPGWLGFTTKGGNRWYIYRTDLTPESLDRALQDLAEKEEAKAEQRRRRDAPVKGKRKALGSVLDGKEPQLVLLKGKGMSLAGMAREIEANRGTLVRKLTLMGIKK